MSFKSFAKLTLISIFLIIVAGSIVRMTGSGMGCPDWPKCFGWNIPPTSDGQVRWHPETSFFEGQMIIYNDQLIVANHDFISGESYNNNNWSYFKKHNYTKFSVSHTWFEYINRLIGAFSGILTFIMFLWSFSYWRTKRNVVFLTGLVVLCMLFQAWLGATVVYSVLEPVKITIHMLMALFIVALMVYLIAQFPNSSSKQLLAFENSLFLLVKIALLLTVIQIIFGTQVRQLIDVIAKSMDYEGRDLWLYSVGNIFKVHRSFAILLVVTNLALFYINYRRGLNFSCVNIILIVVFMEVFSGVVLTYMDMIALMQPVHLLLASLLFVLQISLYFQLKNLRTN